MLELKHSNQVCFDLKYSDDIGGVIEKATLHKSVLFLISWWDGLKGKWGCVQAWLPILKYWSWDGEEWNPAPTGYSLTST